MDRSSAEKDAAARLQRLVERIRRREPLPSRYAYGSRPLREEIVETFGRGNGDGPRALITRNRYGALVLNTARCLFLDVDLPQIGILQRLRRFLSGNRVDPAAAALSSLRDALGRSPLPATFRLYRTAAGFRVIAVDREFEPGGVEAERLMDFTATDRAYVQLCRAQQSFRARLTPKPWRCGCASPPGEYPREVAAVQQQFAAWLANYETASWKFATCRYVDTVGSGNALHGIEDLVDIHDRLTRAREPLPLA